MPPQLHEWLSLQSQPVTGSGAHVYTTKGPLKSPPWARGVYGGQLMAQALLAASQSVPNSTLVQSMHCHFIHPADVELPMTYMVDRVHDGRMFTTRNVQGKQRDRTIVLVTVRFGCRVKSGLQVLQHEPPMPKNLIPPHDIASLKHSAAGQAGTDQPCDCVRCPAGNIGSPNERRVRQWIRTRDQIEEKSFNAPVAHANAAALAYMSDNYFIGTAFRVHNASRFSVPGSQFPKLESLKNAGGIDMLKYAQALAQEELDDNANEPRNDKQVKMMVTLNHTVFFHNHDHVRADEWMLAEMESPWTDDERAIVLQRIWSHEGRLVATCIQEGVVRLHQAYSNGRL